MSLHLKIKVLQYLFFLISLTAFSSNSYSQSQIIRDTFVEYLDEGELGFEEIYLLSLEDADKLETCEDKKCQKNIFRKYVSRTFRMYSDSIASYNCLKLKIGNQHFDYLPFLDVRYSFPRKEITHETIQDMIVDERCEDYLSYSNIAIQFYYGKNLIHTIAYDNAMLWLDDFFDFIKISSEFRILVKADSRDLASFNFYVGFPNLKGKEKF